MRDKNGGSPHGPQTPYKQRLLEGVVGKPVGVRVPPSALYERVGRLEQEPVELPNLIALIRDGSNGSEYPLCHGATVEGVGRDKDPFLDLRREPQ